MTKLLLLVSGVLSLSLSCFAQTTQTVNQCRTPLVIHIRNPYKVKAVDGVSSSTARIGDYVQFQLMDDVYSEFEKDIPNPDYDSNVKDSKAKIDRIVVLIPKDTIFFGAVHRREHRHFPFRQGELEVRLEPFMTWDSQKVEIEISRREQITGADPKKHNRPCKNDPGKCVAGRKNRAVAPIVPAIATAGIGAVAALSDDDAAKAIAATALLTIAAQEKVSELLNGTDAEILKDEVFDLKIISTPKLCPKPASPK